MLGLEATPVCIPRLSRQHPHGVVAGDATDVRTKARQVEREGRSKATIKGQPRALYGGARTTAAGVARFQKNPARSHKRDLEHSNEPWNLVR